MRQQNPVESLAIILAAGESRRMGIPKALLAYSDAETFLEHLAGIFEAAGCQTLAVVGASAEEIVERHPSMEVVRNPSWERGQYSSALVGLAQASARNAQRVLLHPVDMPLVRASTVQALLSALATDSAAVPEYQGAPGHPLALISVAARTVAQQTSAPHLEGALQSLRLRRIIVDDPGVVTNINTAEDYRRAFGFPPRRLSAPTG